MARCPRFVSVHGNSMLPSLSDGDYLFTIPIRWFRFGRLYRQNDIVVVNHPELGRIVKRIESVTARGVVLSGDNQSESTSSAVIGLVPFEQIAARSLFAIRGR